MSLMAAAMEMKSHKFLKGTTEMLKEHQDHPECRVLRLVNVLF